MNRDVYNNQGERLGKIEDVILDLKNQRIVFGILSFGGILGLGEDQYAIPWEMIDYDEDKKTFTLDISKERLEGADIYDPKKMYPNAGPWITGLYGYWGMRPYWLI